MLVVIVSMLSPLLYSMPIIASFIMPSSVAGIRPSESNSCQNNQRHCHIFIRIGYMIVIACRVFLSPAGNNARMMMEKIYNAVSSADRISATTPI